MCWKAAKPSGPSSRRWPRLDLEAIYFWESKAHKCAPILSRNSLRIVPEEVEQCRVELLGRLEHRIVMIASQPGDLVGHLG